MGSLLTGEGKHIWGIEITEFTEIFAWFD